MKIGAAPAGLISISLSFRLETTVNKADQALLFI
jgi:hypothetical protein